MVIKRHVLRNSTHRACIEHRCDNCNQFIFPSDLYTVTVETRGTGKAKWLFVRKEHEHPHCPHEDGDEDTSFDAIFNYVPFQLAA